MAFKFLRHINITEAVQDALRKDLNDITALAETNVKKRTPIDTGRLRNSMHAIPVGARDSFSYRDNVGKTYDGTTSFKGGQLEGAVATNVEYARRIELGHSRQAPEGMMRAGVLQTVAFVNAGNMFKRLRKLGK